jgi:hypothetical protein
MPCGSSSGGRSPPVPAAAPTRNAAVPQLFALTAARTTLERGCLAIAIAETSASSTRARVMVGVPDGGAVLVTTDAAGTGTVALGWLHAPDSRDRMAVEFDASGWASIAAPKLGDGALYQVAIEFPSRARSASVCGAP